ncbi:MAG: SH3 domain-containing protein [Lachnospiraceae bacterium]|nr:SH3 domain-containing protein [Lachnospiraceae bacterium]
MTNNTIGEGLKAKFEVFKDWLVRYSKIVLPVILVVCVALTIVIAVQANKRKVEQEETVVASEENTGEDDALLDVPEVPLEKDAVPGINELFDVYYKAMVEGDTATMEKLVYYMDATEILRAAETSKYIDSYPPLEIYTKAGPKEGTYIAYVYAELQFHDYDKPIPGMRTYYVCTNEDGELYINEDGEESDNELHYMREIQLQADVIDLNNKAAESYNKMVVDDPQLADFLLELREEIEKNVGEALARAEQSEEPEETEEETPEETGEEAPAEVVTKVKTTDVVNIRTSDSETADKLGKADVGDEFELLEEKGNGWSKIRYDGGEAFIKSDFLEPSETMAASEVEQSEDDENEDEDAQEQQADNSGGSTTSNGTVRVKETVRIRKGASENSEKIATAYMGETFEVIMKQADGWTKIKYNGETAYVKSEFVE